MFAWLDFSKFALSAAGRIELDAELNEMLSLTSAPPEATDAVGRPVPNSARVNQPPEPDSFRWIVATRRSAAQREGDGNYIRYADQVLEFFESFGAFSESNPLFVVLIATHKNEYEFLYAPMKKAVATMTVGHLSGPPRKS
jgi:hypothetical protein